MKSGEALLEKLGVGKVSVDLQGKIFEANQASKDLLFGEDQLDNVFIYGICPELSLKEWRRLYNKIKVQGELETILEFMDREGVYFDAKTYLTRGAREGLVAMHFNKLGSVSGDMREIIRTKRQLEEVKFALDNTRVMCLWNDMEGHIVYANKAACEFYGYTETEFNKMHIAEINRSMGSVELQNKVEEVGRSEEFVMQTVHTLKDGSTIPVEVSATRMKSEYRSLNVLFIRDIRARLESVEKDRVLLEEISRLKDRLQEENEYLQGEISSQHSFENIISVSDNYKSVLAQMQRVAETDATVLITGETGTGKELIARAIHKISRRAERSMIRVNCANLPSDLIESELFGHVKGAFTGAFSDKKGRFELAHGGTLFLDEIGELPLELQPKLLRVLQDGEFEKLGDTRTIKVDVRIIAATNRNLQKEVRQKRFRQDLYYRLNVFPIHNIPLRERPEDIPVLVQHFVKKYCRKTGKPPLKIKKATLNRLLRYNFPGNIRELENMVERSVVLSTGKILHLDFRLESDLRSSDDEKFMSFEDAQRRHIVRALERCRWKVTGPNSASELLKMNGKTLASKMRKLQITRDLKD